MAADIEHRRDFGFPRCAVVGFLLAFGAIASASIGLPFLLAGVVAAVTTARRDRHWTANLGFLAGIGAVAITIGAIGEVSAAVVWIVVGVCLAVGPTGAFWWLRCSPHARAPRPS